MAILSKHERCTCEGWLVGDAAMHAAFACGLCGCSSVRQQQQQQWGAELLIAAELFIAVTMFSQHNCVATCRVAHLHLPHHSRCRHHNTTAHLETGSAKSTVTVLETVDRPRTQCPVLDRLPSYVLVA